KSPAPVCTAPLLWTGSGTSRLQRAEGNDHLAGHDVTDLGLVVVVLERALGRVRVGRPLHEDLRTVVALEEQVHDGRVGRGTRLGDEVPLGVVTTRQE